MLQFIPTPLFLLINLTWIQPNTWNKHNFLFLMLDISWRQEFWRF